MVCYLFIYMGWYQSIFFFGWGVVGSSMWADRCTAVVCETMGSSNKLKGDNDDYDG